MPHDTEQESLAPQSRRWQSRKQWLRSSLRYVLPFLAGILAVFAGLFLYSLYAPPPEPLTMVQVEDGINEILAEVTPAPAFSRQVYDIILPSLVVIRINDTAPPGDSTALWSQPNDHPVSYTPADTVWTNRISALDGEVQSEQPFAIGSGVIVNADGAILTAYHVVERAATIDVSFADGTESSAILVAAEPDNNIAVLQPDRLPDVFAPATLGNPGALRIGDEAYAVGNPLGLAGSISAGVISGLDRTYSRSPHELPLQRLIQFDSAVNLGNGGGPLLNRRGEVVGIVVGPVNPTAQETFIGIGFAVRIDAAGGAAGLPNQ